MTATLGQTKLTISEWLQENDLELDRKEVIWLGMRVAQEFRKRYPKEELKRVYRPLGKDKRGRTKHILVGYGYDDRVLPIMNDLIEM